MLRFFIFYPCDLDLGGSAFYNLIPRIHFLCLALWIAKEAAASPCFATTCCHKSRNDRKGIASEKWILGIMPKM
ncbi:hypothetical protein NYG90_00900 [Helicobacter sp. XJK30-2]|uniref:Uncharacterized protein n=1 Tax=Helicobacter zhangjianzhongii TaxID=2974574 RepID=A0ACC6FPU3_9HELI|nr:hypothetical protein [Helicobacter sp. XJK30-2]MDL0081250.1 hypothetical protein [Helicobacter sp. XJK30-2]